METDDGREKFRAAFSRFARPSISEATQSMFPIQPLPPGALPVYSRDLCPSCDRYTDDLKSHSREQCDIWVAEGIMES